MKWSDIKDVVSKTAPIIGTALGGPAGSAIGAMVSSALGVENTPQSVADAVKNNPDSLIKLKQLENDSFATETKDRQDARNKNQHSKMPAMICCFLTLSLSAYIGMMFFVSIPSDNQRMIDTLFGSFLTAWLSSVYYWTGTTRSSAEKTKAMENKAP